MGWNQKIGNINDIMLFKKVGKSPAITQDYDHDFFEDQDIQNELASMGITKEEFISMEKNF